MFVFIAFPVYPVMLFPLFLFAMIALAWLFPGPGAAEGPFSLHEATNYGVSIIFLLYGIGLSPRQFRDGLSNLRLHLLVHSSTFLLFPLLALIGYAVFANDANRPIWAGIFYLAILPSTVSSSVVFVVLARGNIPAAVFNASLSGLIGIVLTPLWWALFPGGNPGLLSPDGNAGGAFDDTFNGTFDPLSAIVSLTVLIVLPIVLGILLNAKLGDWVERHRRRLRLFDQSVIMLIVYCSFSRSFVQRSFDGFGLMEILFLAVGMILIFFLVYGTIALIARLLRFSKEDTITATFCGSKKSLMHGTVMGKVLLAGMSGPGVILLPLMLYHALQLLIVGVIAFRSARNDDRRD
ncbi:MAG TPA: hypothetical protein DEB39_03010 [Planctomycetaceae bacterium]|nr:hypothetical protein [Planctomycetaceae bacterium]